MAEAFAYTGVMNNESATDFPDTLNLPDISSPQDLTVELFSRLLTKHYGIPITVTALTIQSLSIAILSQVAEIVIDTEDEVPKSYVAKFLRPDLPLHQMFQVEGAFYRNYSHHVPSFSIPVAIHSGPRFLLLVKVDDVTEYYNLLHSCPDHYVGPLLTRMAEMHAHFWRHSSFSDLSPSAGIGSALSGLDMERMFPRQWNSFVDRLQYTPNDRLVCLCQDFSTRRLREIHDTVRGFRPTLIHGDFHVGNLLFEEDDVWLLDWATCGAGNPLMDLVFFLLVSTRSTPYDMFHTWFPYYYQALTQKAPHIQSELSLECGIDIFRECLLNQFIVLVCYDDTCRAILGKEDARTQDYYLQHFHNVNRRCVDCVLSEDMTGYPLPSHKPKQEQDLDWGDAAAWKDDSIITEL